MYGWFVNRKERKALNDKEKEKFRNMFAEGTNDSLFLRYAKKNRGSVARNIYFNNNFIYKGVSQTFSDFYLQQPENYDFSGRYNENNNEYLRNKEKIQKNRRIFRRVCNFFS